jgi:pimeloyl-ACP methyl ester carboxylesterase
VSFFTKLPRELYRADAFSAFKAGRDFDLGTARAMAWMSQLAYETDEPLKIETILRDWQMSLAPDGILAKEVGTVLPKASTRGIVAVGRGATIVAFAGTDPAVLANWISDFDVGVGTGGSAEGFAVATDAVWPGLKALLTGGAANAAVYVAGHSLGAAIAALTAQKISTQGVAPVEAVYTIGMPRPGRADFASSYNPLLGARTYRLVQGDDIVPSVAPSFLNFRHVGRHLHCERGEKFTAGALAADTTSDEPLFHKGASKDFSNFLHDPLARMISDADRLKLAAALAFGRGPAGMRTDPGGIAIELLPPRLRDHMPDRYIGALTP